MHIFTSTTRCWQPFATAPDARAKGYQTLINETLRAAITPEAVPVTVEALRRVLREELCGAA